MARDTLKSQLTVGLLMDQPAPTIPDDATLADAATAMLRARVGCVVVVDHDDPECVVGILTPSSFAPHEQRLPFSFGGRGHAVMGGWVGSNDELALAFRDMAKVPARRVMSQPVLVIEPSASLLEAGRIMSEHNVKRLAVVDEGRLVGIIGERDFLKLFEVIEPV
jgi:CBS domain-containing protein